eukprot:Gb_30297 [translate_table: standard]
MKGKIILIYCVTLFCCHSQLRVTASDDEELHVWPKPTSIVWGKAVPTPIPLSPAFKILSPNHKHLLNAASRYRRLIFSEQWFPIRSSSNYNIFSSTQTASLGLALAPAPCLKTLHIFVHDLHADLQHGISESYTLTIPGDASLAANLSAQTPWGAMRGLETFSQLVRRYNATSVYPLVIQRPVKITDRPLFPHRGVLLDTSRNFYPVKDILRTIRALSYNKLNVFHWHITDSHSFPIELPTEPELALKGSYGPQMRYSSTDVKKIVEYGLDHVVRVIPEIDTPGHSASWAEAYPEIVTCAGTFWSEPATSWADRMASEPGSGQLNPLNPKTYRVMKNVVNDVSSLFPDNFYHGGSDEVVPGCWKADSDVQKFLADGGSSDQLLEKFISTTHPYITAHNKTVIYWEDVLLDEIVKVRPEVLPRETTILQSWNNGPNNTKRITSAGYRAIVSSADFYYLDCGHGGWLGNDSRYDRQISDNPNSPFNYNGGNGGSWCAPFKTWQRVYDYDITYGLSEEESKLVLGGEVALFSEQADQTVLDGLLWPRASAMAESLWSGNRDGPKKRYAEAMDRLNEWRYRMVERGINAEPLQPLWCLKNPGMCNLDQ